MSSNGVGWRTLVVEGHSRLSLRNGSIVVEKERNEIIEIPISQIGKVIITTLQSSITTALLNELIKNNIVIIFCNEKKNPSSQLIGFNDNSNRPGIVIKQSEWKKETKNNIWDMIVKQKITNQINALKDLKIKVPDKMYNYIDEVKNGDLKNVEARAAKMYFNRLFGNDFNRDENNEINAALNYGYSIILSEVNRDVSLHGMNMTLGIKHHSIRNPYNLSCDLMEPFRPIIDKIVFQNGGKPLDKKFKVELVNSLKQEIVFKNKHMSVEDAINEYIVDIMNELMKESELLVEEKVA